MSRILYFDCFSGASGDMILGALLDLGLPLEELRRGLGSLALPEIEISADRVMRAGVSATKFRVGGNGPDTRAWFRHRPDHAALHARHDREARAHGHAHGAGDAQACHAAGHASTHDHRSLDEIAALIERSALSQAGKRRAHELFRRLGEAEAAIHRVPLDRVHLHEVGALDSIIDIVGAVHAIEWFGPTGVVSSPLNVGSGTVVCEHGTYPVPAPATIRLLQGTPIYGEGDGELVTPTGALLVTGYASRYGAVPPMRVERVGYGAGERDVPGRPNVLRVMLGHDEEGDHRRVVVLEFEVDDMNPQIFGVLMESLYDAGALEVFYVPIQMKKSRPGVLATVVAPPDRREAVSDIVFRETTTIGVRHHEMARECLEREWVTVTTPAGAVRVKVARRQGAVLNAAPEFEDCARLARDRGLPVKDIQAMALRAFLESRDRSS